MSTGLLGVLQGVNRQTSEERLQEWSLLLCIVLGTSSSYRLAGRGNDYEGHRKSDIERNVWLRGRIA